MVREHGRDDDPYPWIIWFIWKARNEKLFRRISREPPYIVRHAEAECSAWFAANDRPTTSSHSGGPARIQPSTRSQPPTLKNVCLVDGSWSPTDQNSGLGRCWYEPNGKLVSGEPKAKYVEFISYTQSLRPLFGQWNTGDTERKTHLLVPTVRMLSR